MHRILCFERDKLAGGIGLMFQFDIDDVLHRAERKPGSHGNLLHGQRFIGFIQCLNLLNSLLAIRRHTQTEFQPVSHIAHHRHIGAQHLRNVLRREDARVFTQESQALVVPDKCHQRYPSTENLLPRETGERGG